jgi:hypothetical protein
MEEEKKTTKKSTVKKDVKKTSPKSKTSKVKETSEKEVKNTPKKDVKKDVKKDDEVSVKIKKGTISMKSIEENIKATMVDRTTDSMIIDKIISFEKIFSLILAIVSVLNFAFVLLYNKDTRVILFCLGIEIAFIISQICISIITSYIKSSVNHFQEDRYILKAVESCLVDVEEEDD